MGLGTKNRQKQTADIFKQHLREKYRDKLGLVESEPPFGISQGLVLVVFVVLGITAFRRFRVTS